MSASNGEEHALVYVGLINKTNSLATIALATFLDPIPNTRNRNKVGVLLRMRSRNMARWRKWDGQFAAEVLAEDQDALEAGAVAVNHSIGRGKTQELVKQLVISKSTLDAVLKRYGEDTWSNQPKDEARTSMRGVRESSTPSVRAKWSGRGRALALKKRVLEQSQKRPGHSGRDNPPTGRCEERKIAADPQLQDTSRSVKGRGTTSSKGKDILRPSEHPRFTWSIDENTLCLCNIPLNQTEEMLREVINDFGIVTHCTILPGLNEAGLKTAYIRMEKHSACDWVISCFHGNPFDDLYAEDVACFYAIHQYEPL